MIQKVESFNTMRESRMEIREKQDLFKQNQKQAIEAEEKRFVDLTNNNEKKEIFKWILHPILVGKGWLHD